MPNDSQSSTRTHRLLLPAHIPPPPIPPGLLSRFLEPRKPSTAPTAAPVWLDRDEFAMASRAHAVEASNGHLHTPSARPADDPPLPYGPNTALPPPSMSSHASLPLHTPYHDAQLLLHGGWHTRADEHGHASTTKPAS